MKLDFKELDFKELGVLGYLLGVLGYSDLLGMGAFSAIPIYWDWAFPMNGFWISPNTRDFWLNRLQLWSQALVSEPGFLKFQIFRFSILYIFCFGKYVRKICW